MSYPSRFFTPLISRFQQSVWKLTKIIWSEIIFCEKPGLKHKKNITNTIRIKLRTCINGGKWIAMQLLENRVIKINLIAPRWNLKKKKRFFLIKIVKETIPGYKRYKKLIKGELSVIMVNNRDTVMCKAVKYVK